MDEPSQPEPDQLSAEQLLAAVYALAKADRQKDIVALVERELSVMQERPASIEDGETCRLTMLALIKLGRYYDGWVWRVRVMLLAVQIGWTDGIAALLQTEALRVQAVANDSMKMSEPGYVVAPQARAILDELRPFIGHEGPSGLAQPSPSFNGRCYFEKTALLDYADGNYEAAMRNYTDAKSYLEGDERGRLKVKGGFLNALYQSTSDPEVRSDATQRTTALAAECRDLGHDELAKLAAHNVQLMESEGPPNPYESL